MIVRLRQGTVSPPPDEMLARYDARHVAAEFDKVVAGLQRAGERKILRTGKDRQIA